MTMRPPFKLALTGKMRSGKDTVADYLVSEYGYKKYGFGDGIREVEALLFPDTHKKERTRLQQIGQSLRQVEENVWVDHTLRQIKKEGHDRIVIKDLRQPNEYARLQEAGFSIVRVLCTEDIRLNRMRAAGDVFHPDDIRHETEQYVDHFVVDWELENNSIPLLLRQQIDRMLFTLSQT